MSLLAISTMTKVMQDIYGNPSSIHSHGRLANKLLREARQDLAKLLGTKPDKLFFTAGGTESNNTAIIGYCLRNQHRLLMWNFKIARTDVPTSYPFNWNEASMRITSSLKSWSTLRRCSTCEQL